jgi:hypothetical protein
MPFWLALAVAIALTVASLVYLTLKALEAFRAFKSASRSMSSGLEHVVVTSGEIERHLQLAAESGTRLEASLARLSTSRAQLNVLTSALQDVRAAVDRVTGVVPRK